MKIKNYKSKIESGTKRFYAPASITSKCPECGESVTVDLRNDYLSYPTLNGPSEVGFWHEFEGEDGEYGDHNWSEWVLVRITLEVW